MLATKILIAEDNPQHRQLLCLSLDGDLNEFDVTMAATGEEVKQLLRSSRFDCVVLDFRLPDTTADALLLDLRDDLESQGCPTLVISSNKDQAIAIQSFRSGSVDFIPKKDIFINNVLGQRILAAISNEQSAKVEQRKQTRTNRELIRLTETDPLTGLYNRRYLSREMEQGNFARDRRREMALIMIDIDRFKTVNDTHGHAIGDTVLTRIAMTVSQRLVSGDAAIRWGGDEFLVIKSSCSLLDAWLWAEDLRATIAQSTLHEGERLVTPTVSLGITSFPTAAMSEEMIEQADAAMYLAKSAERDRVCTWPMVVMDRALRSVDARKRTVQECLGEVLARCKDQLGPTQLAHIVDHCQRTAVEAGRVGHAMGLSGPVIEQIKRASLLHDLGKAVVPESLLAQVEPLTNSQAALIRRHADLGADMCIKMGLTSELATAIRYHHGVGPTIRTSPAIELIATVIHVADVLAAMTEERSYRPPTTREVALNELSRSAVSHFETQVITAVRSTEAAQQSVE